MEIKVNDYCEPEHFKALNEANYDVSRSCEYEKNEMHHIHESWEMLLIEEGSADYYISGKKYYAEAGDILLIGSREHHMRRLDQLPFLRYGLGVKPSYYRSLNLGEDLLKVFATPSQEEFEHHLKGVEPQIFGEIIHQMQFLYGECGRDRPFRSQLERSVLTEIAVLLYRQMGWERKDSVLSPMQLRMGEVKEYIDLHYREPLDLSALAKEFFLHPVTISKEFNKCFGYSYTQYINSVRICEGAHLLETTQESVTDIAQQCGYDNVNTFLRQFKQIMETTPLQYRKGMQEWFKRSRQELPHP